MTPVKKTAALLCAGALAVALFQSTEIASATAPAVVKNETFLKNSSHWRASASAKIKRVAFTGPNGVQATPRRSAGVKSVHVASSKTAGAKVAKAGSRVHTAAKVRSSQARRPITVMMREVNANGKTVSWASSSIKPSTKGWRWIGVQLVTKKADSRITLTYTAKKLSERNYLRVKAIETTVSAPAEVTSAVSAPAFSAKPKPPTAKPKPTPTPTATPTTEPAPAPSPAPAPTTCEAIDYSQPGQGTLAFGDEFNGTSVDLNKWRVRNEDSLSFDKARIMARNVTVHDGLLDIAGKRETVGGRDYTTGYLDTIGKFSQRYGHWEMRAKVPTDGTQTRGIWPAFWLRGDSTPGEIDIMETYGSPATQTYNPSSSYAWTVWKDTNRTTGDDHVFGWAHPQNSTTPPIYQDFHTYAVNWSPNCMTFLFDGKVVGSVKTASAAWLKDSFTSPVNIRLNMQIGSSYWGWPDSTHTKPKVNYLIDYVRAYKPL